MATTNGVTAAAEVSARDRQDSKGDELSDCRQAIKAKSSAATHHRSCKTGRKQAPKPTLTEPVEVMKFFANRKGDIVVIAIRQMEGGPPFLDIRKFFTDRDGIMRPTRKGISVAVVRAPDLCDGVTKAVKVAQQLGFIRGADNA